MQNAFDPLQSFKHLLNRWWLIAGITMICALIGLLVSYITPAKYQAEALLFATIDYREINFEGLVDDVGNPATFSQYDADLALSIVEENLLRVWYDAYLFAQSLDPTLTPETFYQNKQIERYHTEWHLRYRHKDPAIAQAIVNYWVDSGIKTMRDAQEEGKIEPYVRVDLGTEAYRPENPIYQNRNTLVLAGTMIGFILGVLLVDFQLRYLKSNNEMG